MSEEAKVLNRGLYSEAPYYFTMFDRKGTPFVYLLFADGSTPFTYLETGLPWITPLCLLHLPPHQPLRHLLPSSSLAMSLNVAKHHLGKVKLERIGKGYLPTPVHDLQEIAGLLVCSFASVALHWSLAC